MPNESTPLKGGVDSFKNNKKMIYEKNNIHKKKQIHIIILWDLH